jgi:hypothetical protein
LKQTLLNGEQITRDWLVWSSFAKGLLCFPCCLFQTDESRPDLSALAKPASGGLSDNWRKLYERVKSHANSTVHVSAYLKWKELQSNIQKNSGIDCALQKQIEEETAKWREILKCCLDVSLFLAERNLPFRGSTIALGDHENGLFLGTLELLSRHNKVLEQHLQEVRRNQESGKLMKTHYLSWQSQNEFIEECGQVVLKAVVNEVLLSCEHDLAKKVNYDNVIESFARRKARKVKLL